MSTVKKAPAKKKVDSAKEVTKIERQIVALTQKFNSATVRLQVQLRNAKDKVKKDNAKPKK